MRNKKLLILVIGMFFLIGALAPMSLAKNFNITSNGNDLFYVNGTSGNSWFGYNVSAVGDFCIEGGNCLSDLSGTAVDGTGSAGYVPYWTDSNTLAYDSGQFFWDATNNRLGIGTSSPGTKLDVNGAIWSRTGGIFSDLFRGYNYDGQLQFNTGDLTLQSGTNNPLIFETNASDEAMRIDSSGNVGIGTSSPKVSLHAVSDSVDDNAPTLGVASGGFYLTNNNEDYGLLMGVDSVGSSWLQAQRTDATATAYDLWLQPSGGNVGIGTSSPSSQLSLYKSSLTSELRLQGYLASDSDVGARIIFQNSHVPTSVFDMAKIEVTRDVGTWNTGLDFYTRPSGSLVQAMRIAGSGNVGIGTTAPDGTLHVYTATAGSVTADTGADDLVVEGSGGTGISILDTDASAERIYFGSPSDNIGAQIEWSYTNNRFIVGTAKTGGYMSLRSGNNVEAVRIDSSGNVGIGTDSPSAKLDVDGGSSDYSAKFTSTDTFSSIIIEDPTTTSYLISTQGTTQVGQTFGSSGNNLVIDSSGNVGIGTTSPQSKLDIFDNTDNSAIDVRTYTGGLDITNDQGASSYGLLRFRGWTGAETLSSSDGTYIQSITNGNNDIDLAFGNYVSGGAVNEIMRLKQNGNVGIGTDSPGVPLEIYGDNQHLRLNDENTTYSDIYQAGGELILKNTFATGPISFYTNSAEKVRITSAGNVGIGTTSPSQKLEVEGSAVFGTTIKTTLNGGDIAMNRNSANYFSATDALGYFVFRTGGYNNRLTISSNGDFNFNSNQMFLDESSGNVGIGTTIPQNKLHIIKDTVNLSTTATDADFGFRISEGAGNDRSLLLGVDDANGFGAIQTMDSGTSWSTIPLSLMPRGGNVGIGTASPGSNLHVYAGASGITPHAYSRLTVEDDDNAGINILTPSTKNGYLLFGDESDSFVGGINYDHVNEKLQFMANNDYKMVVDGNGNVGIGTSSPSYKLDVFESKDGTSAIQIQNDNAGTASASELRVIAQGNNLLFDSYGDSHSTKANSNWIYSTATGSDLIFGTESTARMTIDNGGNVGIGTTSPGEKLEVAGNINVTGGDICITGGNCLSTVTALGGDSGTLDGYDSSFFMPLNTSVVGDFDFNGGWQSGGLTIQDGDIYAQTGWFYQINALEVTNLEVNGSLIPDLDNQFDVGNSSMRWNDGYFGGDVYFGSTNGKLSYFNTATGSYINPADNIFSVYDGSGSQKLRVWNGGSDYLELTPTSIQRYSNQDLALNPSGGNVGIGTTAPNKKFHVEGNVALGSSNVIGAGSGYSETASASYGTIKLYDGTTGGMTLTSAYSGGAEGGINFATGGTSTKLRIDKNGNVGIGTTSPSAKLDVNGAVYLKGGVALDSDGSNTYFKSPSTIYFQTGGSTTAGSFSSTNLNVVGTGTFGANTVISGSGDSYFNGGNVGIGTSSPSYKLEVEDNTGGDFGFIYGTNTGAASISNKVRFGHRANTDLQERTIFDLTSSFNTIADGTRNSLVEFKTANAGTFGTVMVIDGGNVGIGTDSPGAKLDIKHDGTTTNLFRTTDSSGVIRGRIDQDFHFILRNAGGTDVIKIADDQSSYFNGGNVGIGTTSPERQLSLYRDDASTVPQLKIEQDGTGDSILAFQLTSGQGWSMGIDNSGADAFLIHNSGGGVDSSSQFAILPSGNVGIGTASPESKLHVESGYVKAGDVTATNGALQFAGDYSGSNILNTFGSEYSSGATSLGYVVRQKSGSAGFTSTAGNAAFSKGALVMDDELIFYNGAAATVAIGTDVAMTERFKVDSSGNIKTSADVWATDYCDEAGNNCFDASIGIGDITGVTAGTGLIGGGTTGAPTLGINTGTFDNITARAPSTTGYGSGFYETSTSTIAEGWPEDASWYHLINSQHSNTGNNYAMQLAADFFQQQLWFRSTNNNGAQSWGEVWHSNSDGSGSGLDADLLDGQNSAYYLDDTQLSEATVESYIFDNDAATVTGIWSFGARPVFDGGTSGSTSPFTVDSTTVVTNLNADLLDGYNSASASTANTVVRRDSAGDINVRLLRSEYDSTNSNIGFIMTQIDTGSNNYVRPSTPAQLVTGLGLESGGSRDIWVEKAGDTMTGALTTTTINTGSGAMELGDASITNGDINSIPTNDQVYDFMASNSPSLQSNSFTPSSAGWWQIAYTNGGDHGMAVISLYGYTGGEHASAKFLVSNNHGKNTITQIMGETYSGQEFSSVRLMYLASDRVYGGSVFEVYASGISPIYYDVQEINVASHYNEWATMTPVITSSTWTADATLSSVTSTGLATTSNARIGGSLTGTTGSFSGAFSTGALTANSLTVDSLVIDANDVVIPSSNYVGLGASAGRIYFADGATDYITLADANVGIGTFSPSTKLHIYDSALSSTTETDFITLQGYNGDVGATPQSIGILFKTSDTNSGASSTIRHAVVNDVDYGDNDENASNIIFATTNGGTIGPTDKMIITGRGNVGIGNTNPSYKLEVSGNTAVGKDQDLTPTSAGTIGQLIVDGNGYSSYWALDATAMRLGHNSGARDLRFQTDETDRVTIDGATGNVGIATINPSSYKLQVSGTVGATGFYYTSDERLKEKIEPLAMSLDKIMKLQGVSFEWGENVTGPNGTQYGLIAQDVEKIYPGLVSTADDGFKSVQYGNLVSPLIEAVKELNNKTETEIDKLKQENEELRKEMEEIKRMISGEKIVKGEDKKEEVVIEKKSSFSLVGFVVKFFNKGVEER